jgi:hypothetical protein
MPEEHLHNDRDQEEAPEQSPLMQYLTSDKGYTLASRLLEIIEDVKKDYFERPRRIAILEKWQIAIIFGAVVFAVTLLTLFDKFSPAVGILFGVLVGYIIGKKNS